MLHRLRVIFQRCYNRHKGYSAQVLPQQSESLRHKGLPPWLHAIEYEINSTMSMQGLNVVDEGTILDVPAETWYLVQRNVSVAD